MFTTKPFSDCSPVLGGQSGTNYSKFERLVPKTGLHFLKASAYPIPRTAVLTRCVPVAACGHQLIKTKHTTAAALGAMILRIFAASRAHGRT